MARTIPTTPNSNTRPVLMSIVPLEQIVQHIKSTDLDSWGNQKPNSKGEFLPCKVKYSSQRFYLRGANGYEVENTCYILLQGKVKVSTSDIFRYNFPDGDTVDYKPQSTNHLFDMSGNIYLTKVWVK